MPRSAPPPAPPRAPSLLPAALALAALVLLVYWPVREFGFVGYDDPEYVLENPAVRAGLTGQGLTWALTSGHAANWHPLTWLSHMLDVELFGLDPSGPHLVNALLHAASAALLFLVLARAFAGTAGAAGRAAAVALLFALHPLRIESVAWIAERKDVLAAALGLAATLAWVRWAKEGSRAAWSVALVLLALGLTAKPMLVTLPFAWLLLDYWPLRRLHGDPTVRPVVEKLPAFALVAASSVVTWLVQRRAGAMELAAEVPLGERLANAVVAPVRYLGDLVWPRDLSVLYPHPSMPGGTPLEAWQVWGSALLVAGVTVLVLALRARPWLVVGWLWFLGMLVPVLGIVQVGAQSHADRYTYLPSIGILLALVQEVSRQLERLPASARRWAGPLLAGAASLACALATRAALPVWRDSQTLLTHALEIAPEAPVLWNNLGIELRRAGQNDRAAQAYERALAIDPRSLRALYNLGVLRQHEGRLDEAEALYRRTLAEAPAHLPSRVNLAGLSRARGRPAEAVALLEEALALGLDAAALRGNLANALVDLGRAPEAEREFRAGLALDPSALPLRLGYGALLLAQGRRPEAEQQYRAALAIAPQSPEANEGLRRARSGG